MSFAEISAHVPAFVTRLWYSYRIVKNRADTSEELGFQLSLDDLGRPLIDTTFCVLDLETTGTNSQRDLICEIGAVKALLHAGTAETAT